MFIFLIHANEDKAKLKPIVRHFIDDGISLWIDDPRDERLCLSEHDIGMLAGYSVPGDKWKEMSDRAQRRAAAFVFVVSRSSLDPSKDEIRHEARTAQSRKHTSDIPTFFIVLEENELADAKTFLKDEQWFKTFVKDGENGFQLTDRGSREFALLRHKVRDSCDLAAAHEAAKHSRKMTIPVSVYLADRHQQRDELLDTRLEKNSRQILPVLVGTKQDRPDTFLREYLPDKVTRRIFQTDDCTYESVEWPNNLDSDPEKASRYLFERLNESLSEFHGQSMTQVISSQPRPQNVDSFDSIENAIGLWCAVWSKIFENPKRSNILPILDVRFDNLPKLMRLPLIGLSKERLGTHLNGAIRRVGRKHKNVRLINLTPLGNVTPYCAEHWLDTDLLPHLNDDVYDLFRPVLLKGLDDRGLAMQDWGDLVHRSFEQVTIGNREG